MNEKSADVPGTGADCKRRCVLIWGLERVDKKYRRVLYSNFLDLWHFANFQMQIRKSEVQVGAAEGIW